MTSVVLVGYARSSFQFAHKGGFARVRPDDLVSEVVKALVARSKIDPPDFEDLLLGCAFPEGEQGLNLGRIVVLLSGLPSSVAGATLNRYCGSSMEAVHAAAGAIQMGAGDVFIAAGVESMTRVPMMGYNPMPNPMLQKILPGALHSMGQTAETLAKTYGITREEQEAFALSSHLKATAAQTTGKFQDEIVPISTKGGVIADDGCIRAQTTAEALSTLKPAFDPAGSVTAGTSSPLTDGASAVLVCSEEYAQRNGLAILARVKSIAKSGCQPEIMGIGPVEASRKALKRAGLTVSDLDVIELNEAFAVQALACMRELGLPPEKTNLDGGAIALGHPLGATGARIVGKAATLLNREGKRYALAAQCIGGGQGIATLLEAVRS